MSKRENVSTFFVQDCTLICQTNSDVLLSGIWIVMQSLYNI